MNKHFPKLFVITFLGFITACTEGSTSQGNQSSHLTKTINNSTTILAQHKQLILVVTDNWTSYQGHMQRFEKDEKGNWVPIANTIPVVVGKGLGWGIGLNTIPANLDSENLKKEGDGKAPAGIFNISALFVRDTYLVEHPDLKPYVVDQTQKMKTSYIITKSIKAVDDPSSVYYNQIVDEEALIKEGKKIDWKSDEDMHAENLRQLYNMGAVVDHNLPVQNIQGGSCIFIHIWRPTQTPTAGCTAMAEDHMKEVFTWLDDSKQPVLVQLPQEAYISLQTAWGIPSMSGMLLDK